MKSKYRYCVKVKVVEICEDPEVQEKPWKNLIYDFRNLDWFKFETGDRLTWGTCDDPPRLLMEKEKAQWLCDALQELCGHELNEDNCYSVFKVFEV